MSYGAAHRMEMREELAKVRAREAVLVTAIEGIIERCRNTSDSITREAAANTLEAALYAAPAVPASAPGSPVEVILRPTGLGGIFKPSVTIKATPGIGIRYPAPDFECDIEVRR